MNKLAEQLDFEEGNVLEKYLCPAGFWTIGRGHNLDKSPYFKGQRIPDTISAAFSDELFEYDIDRTCRELRKRWPRIDEFDGARRDACINMAFQMGVNGFMRFERMRAAMLARDWPTAHKEAMNSNWSKQTPKRARRVANQILTGKYYEIPKRGKK